MTKYRVRSARHGDYQQLVLVSVPASMDRVIADASGTLRLFVLNRTAPWEDLLARYCDEIDKMPGTTACVGLTGW